MMSASAPAISLECSPDQVVLGEGHGQCVNHVRTPLLLCAQQSSPHDVEEPSSFCTLFTNFLRQITRLQAIIVLDNATELTLVVLPAIFLRTAQMARKRKFLVALAFSFCLLYVPVLSTFPPTAHKPSMTPH